MSGRVVRAPLARADVIGIANFLKTDNPAVARGFLEASRRTMKRLAEMPMLGSECESDAPGLAGLRVWPIPVPTK